MDEELWKTIPEFDNYQISNMGRVYNTKHDHFMRTSFTNFGHVKITLRAEWTGRRFTRSVALLVADAFVEPKSIICDQLILLDGDLTNVQATNLAWRPRWFAWKYTRQLRVPQPTHYHNLALCNIVTGAEYESIIEAGMVEGLLFGDIWRSTYQGIPIYPHGSIFKIVERV